MFWMNLTILSDYKRTICYVRLNRLRFKIPNYVPYSSYLGFLNQATMSDFLFTRRVFLSSTIWGCQIKKKYCSFSPRMVHCNYKNHSSLWDIFGNMTIFLFQQKQTERPKIQELKSRYNNHYLSRR